MNRCSCTASRQPSIHISATVYPIPSNLWVSSGNLSAGVKTGAKSWVFSFHGCHGFTWNLFTYWKCGLKSTGELEKTHTTIHVRMCIYIYIHTHRIYTYTKIYKWDISHSLKTVNLGMLWMFRLSGLHIAVWGCNALLWLIRAKFLAYGSKGQEVSMPQRFLFDVANKELETRGNHHSEFLDSIWCIYIYIYII